MPQGGFQPNARVWEPDETVLLLNEVRRIGPRWKRIGETLGRSGCSVRNRWQRVREDEGGGLRRAPQTRTQQVCRECGQARRGHVCLPKITVRPPARAFCPVVESKSLVSPVPSTTATASSTSDGVDEIPLPYLDTEPELRMLWDSLFGGETGPGY